VQFVNHEPHNVVIAFGHHADAVPLTQTTNEILFRPRKLEAPIFDLENLGHVPPDHPADMDSQILLAFETHQFTSVLMRTIDLISDNMAMYSSLYSPSVAG
jgi:hypothetical protein